MMTRLLFDCELPMEQNVANLLSELRQDHRNMSVMLNLLELESNQLARLHPINCRRGY